MKTLRLFGIALITVLMSVAISSCSKSDDDNNGGGDTSASIEGKWYLKSEIWYGMKNGQMDMSNITLNETYGDYANERVWTFKKSGNDLILTEEEFPDYTNDYTLVRNEYTLVRNGNNDYHKGDYDRFVVKTLSSNSLVVDYYDNYYDDGKALWEYGTYYFMK